MFHSTCTGTSTSTVPVLVQVQLSLTLAEILKNLQLTNSRKFQELLQKGTVVLNVDKHFSTKHMKQLFVKYFGI